MFGLRCLALYELQFMKIGFSFLWYFFRKFPDILFFLLHSQLELSLQTLVFVDLEFKFRFHDIVLTDIFIQFFNLFLLHHYCRNGCIFYLVDAVHQFLILPGEGEKIGLSGGAACIGNSSIQLNDLLSALNKFFFFAVQFLDKSLSLWVLGLEECIFEFILVLSGFYFLVVEIVLKLGYGWVTSMILVLYFKFSSYDFYRRDAKSACVVIFLLKGIYVWILILL